MNYKKGEWYVEDRHTSLAVLCIPEGKDFPIVIADLDTSDCTLLEDEANAHLIAAAPDMYEALKEATKAMSITKEGDPTFAPSRNTIVKMKSALAKAGERCIP